jgi:hypothetical protein
MSDSNGNSRGSSSQTAKTRRVRAICTTDRTIRYQSPAFGAVNRASGHCCRSTTASLPRERPLAVRRQPTARPVHKHKTCLDLLLERSADATQPVGIRPTKRPCSRKVSDGRVAPSGRPGFRRIAGQAREWYAPTYHLHACELFLPRDYQLEGYSSMRASQMCCNSFY